MQLVLRCLANAQGDLCLYEAWRAARALRLAAPDGPALRGARLLPTALSVAACLAAPAPRIIYYI